MRLREWLKAWLEPVPSGVRGEREAARFLKTEKGFRVLARNWRNPRDRRDELDLVCLDRGILVFVEVKTRRPGALVPGFFAVDRRKKKVLRRTADAYLCSLPPRQRPRRFRFDVVEVCLAAGASAVRIRHFENVTLFTKSFWR